MKGNKLAMVLCIVSLFAAIAAAVTAVVLLLEKKKKDDEELEHYLDCSIQ